MAPALGVRRRGAGLRSPGDDGAYAADGRVAAGHGAGGQGRLRDAMGPRRGAPGGGRAGGWPAGPICRRGLHGRRPRLSVGHRDHPFGREPADMASTMSRLVTEHRADVVAVDSAFTEAGISLGSNEVVALKAPRVLLAWDAPTSSQSAGWARYVLERRFGAAGDRRPRQRAHAGRPDALRRRGAAVGQLFVGADRPGAAAPEGLGVGRRHAHHDRRGDALGDARWRQPARHDAGTP